MSATGLKKITIEHLRGSVASFSLPFEKGKKLTVVYGENGTGKSTICDAFDFVGNGKVGSLEKRGLGKTNRFWSSVGKKSSDITVCLEATDSKCTGKVQKAEVACEPIGSKPKVQVLRRSQILSLVEAPPVDRYTAIKSFIDLTGIEASEEALRALIRDVERERTEAFARVGENQQSLTQFWQSGGSHHGSFLKWAEAECAKDTAGLAEELREIGNLRATFSVLSSYPPKHKDLSALMEGAVRSVGAASLKLGESINTVAEGSAEIVGILEAALVFLEVKPNPESCPLCESKENVDNLAKTVVERLQSFSSLQAARKAKENADKAVEDLGKKLAHLTAEALKHAEELNDQIKKTKWGADVRLPKQPAPSTLPELAAWVEENKLLPIEWGKAESSRQNKSKFASTLKKALDTYKINFDALKFLDALTPRLKRALEIVQAERRTFTDSVLAKIAEEVGELYELVHPLEGLSKISLILDPNKRASLDIATTFCGEKDAPPQAYFSDSHLDTLGLCIFLALALVDNPAQTILVLDDVLASVDEPHVDRLIEMLYSVAIRFRHCVITTHYRPWKQKLRWGWLQNGQCQFVELTKWTTTGGLTLIRTVPDVERLRDLLKEAPPDPQLICAKAGVILEAALDFLTLLYECSVPRRAMASSL